MIFFCCRCPCFGFRSDVRHDFYLCDSLAIRTHRSTSTSRCFCLFVCLFVCLFCFVFFCLLGFVGSFFGGVCRSAINRAIDNRTAPANQKKEKKKKPVGGTSSDWSTAPMTSPSARFFDLRASCARNESEAPQKKIEKKKLKTK